MAELEQQIAVEAELAVEVDVKCSRGHARELGYVRNICPVITALIDELRGGGEDAVERVHALFGPWYFQ